MSVHKPTYRFAAQHQSLRGKQNGGAVWHRVRNNERRCTRFERAYPMLSRSLAERSLAHSSFNGTVAPSRVQLPSVQENDGRVIRALPGRHDGGSLPRNFIEISPAHAVACRCAIWNGVAAQIVRETSREFVEYRFQAPVHMLIVHERGVRQRGETFAEGLPQSTLRDMPRKLTFVPAGHAYRESHHPRVLGNALYV